MTNIIDTIYNNKTHNINWENVWNIPEFNKLIQTPQSTVWHKEGNVSIHTKMVVEAMREKVKNNTDEKFIKIMILSALFHDIGKGETTFFNKEKNNWSATNHAEVGEKLTRALLWYEDPIIRESVCYFVRNHMKPMYICDSVTGIRDIITISCDTIYPQYCTFKNLILLKTCDNLGSIFDYDDWREKLDFAESLADELNCLDKPYQFINPMTKYTYFNETTDSFPVESADKLEFETFITIGATKFDTTSEFNHPLKVLVDEDCSIDIVDQIIENCEEKNNFILDLTTIPQNAWENLFNVIYLYHGKITFVYGSNKFIDYISPTFSMSTINAN